jgi:hypothetical protein
MREHRTSDPADTMRWIRRGVVLALLLVGWVFILNANNFHIGPAVVFICLAYFAGVAALYTLFRLGATAVAPNNEEDDAMSWVKPLGALDELEHEKRALLKAIKEAEFDLQMGKLSKADADAMITIYRTRAIEVIKEIDVQTSATGKLGSVRDQILREARARIEIEAKAAAVSPSKKKRDKPDKAKQRADKLADAVNAAKSAKPDAAVAATDDVTTADAADAATDDADGDGAADAAADGDAAKADAAKADGAQADGDAAKADAAKADAADKPAADAKPDIAAADKPAAKSDLPTDPPDAKSDSKNEAKEAAR